MTHVMEHELMAFIEAQFEEKMWPVIVERATGGDPVKIMQAEEAKDGLKLAFMQGFRVGIHAVEIVSK